MDEPNSERIITPMPKSLVAAIDDFRFSNRIASRAEALRILVQKGLEVFTPDVKTSETPKREKAR